MLCPKCGFISFDHLVVCGKCRNDLSVLGLSLHGTAAGSGQNFLGSVLKGNIAQQDEEQYESVEGLLANNVPFEQAARGESADAMGESAPEGSGQEDPMAAFPASSASALEFDLDEIPHLDGAVLDSLHTEQKTSVAASDELGAVSLIDLKHEEGGDYRGDFVAVGELDETDRSLEIDASSLTLNAFETKTLSANMSSAEDGQSEPLTIDLNEIDLSDLVHNKQSGPLPVSGIATMDEEGGLDFDDSMDLSLLVGENQGEPVGPMSAVSKTGQIESIDLSLVDEALVELAVDPSRKAQTFQEEGHSDILELSMEDNK